MLDTKKSLKSTTGNCSSPNTGSRAYGSQLLRSKFHYPSVLSFLGKFHYPYVPFSCKHIGRQDCSNLPIGSSWFAWFGLCKPTANQMFQNPNQFFRHPIQNVFYPNHFSQIVNLHTNHLSSHPNKHLIPCKSVANQCQTGSGIGNPGQYYCCVRTVRYPWCVSTSFRFRAGLLEFNQSPKQRNHLQPKLHSQQQQQQRWQRERRRRQALEVAVKEHHRFGHEISYGGPRVASC